MASSIDKLHMEHPNIRTMEGAALLITLPFSHPHEGRSPRG
jgi:hypothetical protein